MPCSALLGEPQRGLQAIHVVGTNGKSTTTRTIEALLLAEGIVTGAYLSPHVTSWAERIRVERRRVRPRGRCSTSSAAPATVTGATQFETLTAAAFVAFRSGGVDVAVVEAGLGGRLDATNVLDRTIAVVLTNVGLEHTDVLGRHRGGDRAREARRRATRLHVVLGEPEHERARLAAGAAEVEVVASAEPATPRPSRRSSGTSVDPPPAVRLAPRSARATRR